jgi:hypothetical protein
MVQARLSNEISIVSSVITAAVRDAAFRASDWWKGECLNLIPTVVRQRLSRLGPCCVIVDRSSEAVRLELIDQAGNRVHEVDIPEPNVSSKAIDDFLLKNGRSRTEVPLGLRLPRDKFFVRQTELPRQATKNIREIAKQEILSRTPFRINDIHLDYRLVAGKGSKAFVLHQCLIRRDFANEAAAALNIPIEEVAFLSVAGTGQVGPEATVWLRDRERLGSPRMARANRLLSGSFLFLLACAGFQSYLSQQAELDRLGHAIEQAQGRARSVRSILDRAENDQGTFAQIREIKASALGLSEIWTEVTKLVPRDAWLTEIRLQNKEGSESRLSINGFSASATRLVDIFDSSDLFADAQLVGAVVRDATEDRDRFTLQAKVKSRSATSPVGAK